MKYTLDSLQQYLCKIHDDCEHCPLTISTELSGERCAISLVLKVQTDTEIAIQQLKEEKETN